MTPAGHSASGVAAHTAPATRAEVAAAACGDLFIGAGEILASPIGVVPSVGARLARLTHAPGLLLSDGESTLFADTPPVGEAFQEPEGYLPYSALFDLIESGRRHVIMGAAQLDRHGNQNLSAIGDRDQPTRQLVGARAAATNSANHPVSYWVARHAPRVFVERVDIVTGIGTDRSAGMPFHQLRRVVTNLGVFDFGGPGGTMNVVSLHPGVTLDEAQAATGFPLSAPAVVPETRTPTSDELRLIREVIDPHNLRKREVPHP